MHSRAVQYRNINSRNVSDFCNISIDKHILFFWLCSQNIRIYTHIIIWIREYNHEWYFRETITKRLGHKEYFAYSNDMENIIILTKSRGYQMQNLSVTFNFLPISIQLQLTVDIFTRKGWIQTLVWLALNVYHIRKVSKMYMHLYAQMVVKSRDKIVMEFSGDWFLKMSFPTFGTQKTFYQLTFEVYTCLECISQP